MRPRTRRPTRLPVQTGASSIFHIDAFVICVSIFFAGLYGMRRWPTGFLALFAILSLWFGIVLLLVCLGFIWKAARRRASDIVFSAEGVSLEGGPYHGRTWRWIEMSPTRSSIMTDSSEADPGNETGIAQLLVIQGVPVAKSTDVAEQATFAAVLDAVRAGCATEPQALTLDARALICARCGAAVSPADADTVVCHSCSVAVPVANDLRARIRDVASISAERARSHRLAARLVSQPGAAFTNVLLSLLWAAAFVGTWAAMRLLMSRHHAGVEALAPLGLCLLALGSARLAVASRKALRVLVIGFAARPPSAQGAPFTCRRCGGPLCEPPEGQAVSRCVYCRTTNVLVILPRPTTVTPPEEETASELESALRHRRYAGLRWLVTAAISAASFWFGVRGT